MFKRNDYIVAIGSILIGIFILLQSSELTKRVKMSIDPAGPAALPNLMAYIIIGIGIVHIIGAIYAAKVTKKGETKGFKELVNQYKAVVYVSIACILYAEFMSVIGYLILTPILIAALMWIVQVRDYKLISKASIIMTIILFVTFRFGLQVKLPLGIIGYFLG